MKNKNIKYIGMGIIGILALIALFFFVSIAKDVDNAGGAIDGFISYTFFVLAIAVLATVAAWLMDVIAHPSKLKQTGVAAIAFLVVVGIAKFAFASNKGEQLTSKLFVDAKTSNWIDTGLYTFYILAIIAILLVFLSPVLTSFGGKSSLAVEELADDVEELAEEISEDEE